MILHSACDDIRPTCWRCNDAKRLETPMVPRFLPCQCEAAQFAVEGNHPRVQTSRPEKRAKA